ncbi:heavy metal-associated isoprenylated plant protein 3-like [Malus sylvestris]|uniref:heavy metal-associated isoprenylated plant protein 3-like n=1 Tax=Malus sylvestris TaxID=3752 RepID=UPI0021AD26BD|nr:heavy metal-associated isoprenylated plant protein 3-like [Malus sylvestris]
MAKKKKGGGGGDNNAGNTASNDGGEKKKGDGGEKKEETPITVILKIDMHCEGCATKIVKCVKGFAGVETVKSESQANKLTVVGKVDPTTLRDKLAAKTNKKVDLVSPQPKKDNKDDGGDAKKKPPEKSNDDKKTKEPPVTTAVLKLNLHCQGCIQKIHKTVTKTKGFTEMSIDKEKELLTVKGSMDMKVLAESLKEKLKRSVDIVPPKKEKEKGENNGGGGGGGGDKKKKEGEEGKEGGKLEGNRMDFPPGPTGYGQQIPYVMPYGPGYGAPGYPIPPPPMYIGNPPEMFSDENPNACSIM